MIFFWSIPSEWKKARFNFVIFISFIFLYSIAPFALGVILFQILFVHFYTKKTFKGQKTVSLFRFWLGVIILILPMIYLHKKGVKSPIYNLGVSFATLKSLGVYFLMYAKRENTNFKNLLGYMLFYPIYSAGPIEKYLTFEKFNFNKKFDLSLFNSGIARFSIGLLKASFICDTVLKSMLGSHFKIASIDPGSMGIFETILYIFTKFLYTYLNFSAYSDIAIGIGLMFGVKIMENFNHPYRATNLQDFWRRWHISLGDWVMQFIFFPLFSKWRFTGGMQLAMFTSFFLIGIWHEFSATYLLWGVLHGTGLAIVQTIRKNGKNWNFYQKISKFPAYKYSCWALTLFFVAWVQTFANSKNLSMALDMTWNLFGF